MYQYVIFKNFEILFVFLDPKNLNNEDFEEALMLSIMRETTTVQKAIYRNQLRDDDDCLDYMMKQPNIMPRLNDRILKADNAAFVDLTGRVALKM